MAIGKYENLVTPYPYDLLQPSDKNFLGGELNLLEVLTSLKNRGLFIFWNLEYHVSLFRTVVIIR